MKAQPIQARMLPIFMKTLRPIHLVLTFLCLLPLSLSAQGWLDLGVKAAYGLTGFYNGNLIDDPQHSYDFQSAVSFGGVAGLNFGNGGVINVEGLFLNNSQGLAFTENGEKTQGEVEWNNLDLYLMCRFYLANASYLEFGPKMSLVRSTGQVFGRETVTTTDLYADNYYSAALGFGTFLTGNEAMTLKMGVRLEYALTDFVTEAGQAEGLPAFYTSYDSYAPSRPFRASIGMEVNFAVGQTGKRICGRRKFVFE